MDVDGTGHKDQFVQFPMSSTLGAHILCTAGGFCARKICCKCECCVKAKPSALEPYGIGLVLYFKMVKFMSIVFLLMTLALLPSMYFYWKGSALSTEDKALLFAESPLNGLFFTTIGSLGAGAATCMSGVYGESFDVSCCVSEASNSSWYLRSFVICLLPLLLLSILLLLLLLLVGFPSLSASCSSSRASAC